MLFALMTLKMNVLVRNNPNLFFNGCAGLTTKQERQSCKEFKRLFSKETSVSEPFQICAMNNQDKADTFLPLRGRTVEKRRASEPMERNGGTGGTETLNRGHGLK